MLVNISPSCLLNGFLLVLLWASGGGESSQKGESQNTGRFQRDEVYLTMKVTINSPKPQKGRDGKRGRQKILVTLRSPLKLKKKL